MKASFSALAVCDPKRIVLVTAGAVTQNTAVIGRSVGRIARDILLSKADAHKGMIRQALENQSLVNAVFEVRAVSLFMLLIVRASSPAFALSAPRILLASLLMIVSVLLLFFMLSFFV